MREWPSLDEMIDFVDDKFAKAQLLGEEDEQWMFHCISEELYRLKDLES